MEFVNVKRVIVNALQYTKTSEVSKPYPVCYSEVRHLRSASFKICFKKCISSIENEC